MIIMCWFAMAFPLLVGTFIENWVTLPTDGQFDRMAPSVSWSLAFVALGSDLSMACTFNLLRVNGDWAGRYKS